jgi:hypothetical protein
MILNNYINKTKTVNKFVACSPFPKMYVEKVISSGMARVDKKVNLQELKVVFSSESLISGQKVLVRGDTVTQHWAKEIFSLEGLEFILVPESAIMVVLGD